MYAALVAEEAEEKSIIAYVLQRVGLSVITFRKTEDLFRKWEERPVDIIVIAWKGGDVVPVVRYVRNRTFVPLLLITDPLPEHEQAEILENGADVLMLRPVGMRLLMAQARALLRRSPQPFSPILPTLRVGDLTLDPATRTVQVKGYPPRRLTHLEFRLLYTLILHRGQVLSTDLLVEQVWGYTDIGDRTLVRGLIRRLRSKIEPDPHHPRYIHTVHGIGYTFGESVPE